MWSIDDSICNAPESIDLDQLVLRAFSDQNENSATSDNDSDITVCESETVPEEPSIKSFKEALRMVSDIKTFCLEKNIDITSIMAIQSEITAASIVKQKQTSILDYFQWRNCSVGLRTRFGYTLI